MTLENHSIIENTTGSIREVTDLRTKLKIIEGLQEVLKYERLQAIKQLPETDPDYVIFVEGSSMDQPPQFDS